MSYNHRSKRDKLHVNWNSSLTLEECLRVGFENIFLFHSCLWRCSGTGSIVLFKAACDNCLRNSTEPERVFLLLREPIACRLELL